MSNWVEIDDAWVDKGLNGGSTIEVGDIIKRYPTTSRYIEARVDILPYTDDNNLTFTKDINII